MGLIICEEEVVLAEDTKARLKARMQKIMEAMNDVFRVHFLDSNRESLEFDTKLEINDGSKYAVHAVVTENDSHIKCSTNYGRAQYSLSASISGSTVEGIHPKHKEARSPEPQKEANDTQQYRLGGRGRRIPSEARDSIAREFSIGMTIEQLVKKYGISAASVQKILKEHGMDPRRKNVPTGDSKQRMQKYFDYIVADLAEGKRTHKELAVKYQIHENDIAKFANKYAGRIEEKRRDIQVHLNGPRDVRENISRQVQFQRPNGDLESKILEELIRADLNYVEIASKYQTNTAVVSSIADFNSKLIARGKQGQRIPQIPKKVVNDPSNGGLASSEQLKKMKEHFSK